jgi:hypothetical protein
MGGHRGVRLLPIIQVRERLLTYRLINRTAIAQAGMRVIGHIVDVESARDGWAWLCFFGGECERNVLS